MKRFSVPFFLKKFFSPLASLMFGVIILIGAACKSGAVQLPVLGQGKGQHLRAVDPDAGD